MASYLGQVQQVLQLLLLRHGRAMGQDLVGASQRALDPRQPGAGLHVVLVVCLQLGSRLPLRLQHPPSSVRATGRQGRGSGAQ